MRTSTHFVRKKNEGNNLRPLNISLQYVNKHTSTVRTWTSLGITIQPTFSRHVVRRFFSHFSSDSCLLLCFIFKLCSRAAATNMSALSTTGAGASQLSAARYLVIQPPLTQKYQLVAQVHALELEWKWVKWEMRKANTIEYAQQRLMGLCCVTKVIFFGTMVLVASPPPTSLRCPEMQLHSLPGFLLRDLD